MPSAPRGASSNCEVFPSVTVCSVVGIGRQWSHGWTTTMEWGSMGREERTDRSISMPPRGKAPGLKRNRHGSPYWVAANVARDLKSFPDKCIPLPRDADENTFARLCHEHTASLRAWLDQHTQCVDPLPGYDGTILSLSRP